MALEPHQLLLLLNWMSPAFPIGAYAYSHGLEQAIANGEVQSGADTESWIGDVISRGSGWNDAVLFVEAYREAEVNDLALALCPCRERHAETTQLGAAFLVAARVFATVDAPEREIAYPVAAARACKAMQIELPEALLAFLQGFSNALVSVAVRLVPIGQTAGLQALRALMPVIADTATRALNSTVNDLGGCCILSDIAAMKHEDLESRIFRT